LAAAACRSVEPVTYALGARDQLVDRPQLAARQVLELGVRGLARVAGVQQHSDVVE